MAVWCFNIEHLKRRALEVLTQEFGGALKENQNLINEDCLKYYFIKTIKALYFLLDRSE